MIRTWSEASQAPCCSSSFSSILHSLQFLQDGSPSTCTSRCSGSETNKVGKCHAPKGWNLVHSLCYIIIYIYIYYIYIYIIRMCGDVCHLSFVVVIIITCITYHRTKNFPHMRRIQDWCSPTSRIFQIYFSKVLAVASGQLLLTVCMLFLC